jgi:hypothetical protein
MNNDEVPVLGGPLNEPIHWKGRQWAVTGYGIEKRDGTYYIDKERLWEDDDVHPWEKHMKEKDWVDIDDFRAAMTEARKIYASLKPKS